MPIPEFDLPDFKSGQEKSSQGDSSVPRIVSGVVPYVASPQFPLLIEQLYTVLLPIAKITSLDPHEPVHVEDVPVPWEVIGAGNYAAVFGCSTFPEVVVKVYASNRSGFEEEREVYRRIGSHPAFSESYYAADGVLVLKRLRGVTLYDCVERGLRIPRRVILDIDRALDYARRQGLHPHDVHGRNVMMDQHGRGLVVDISDFLKDEPCSKWQHLKRAYYWVYLPIIAPLRLRLPYSVLDWVRRTYRRLMSRSR